MPLADLADGTDPAAKGLSFGEPGQMFELLLLRHGPRVTAYKNECPHARTTLEFMPGRFFNLEKTHLLCSTHGALFRFEDGACVDGPCPGKHLPPVPIALGADGMIVVGPDGTSNTIALEEH